MARRMIRLLLTAVAVAVATLAGAPTAAQSDDTHPDARVATFVPGDGNFAGGYEVLSEVLAPGELTCVGGTPTGDFPPCSEGTRRILVQGRTSEFVYLDLIGAAAELFAGVNTVETNCDFDRNYQGECRGKFEWNLGETGTWRGVWTGSMDLASNQGFYTAVGQGYGGRLARLTFRLTAVYPGGEAPAAFAVRVTYPLQLPDQDGVEDPLHDLRDYIRDPEEDGFGDSRH